jgi:hypothetical protein
MPTVWMADHVAGRRDVAADHGAHLAVGQKQAGVIQRAGGGFHGLFERPALGFPFFKQQLDEPVLSRVGRRIDQRDAVERHATGRRQLADGPGASNQPRLGDRLLLQDARRLKRPRVLGVRKGHAEALAGGFLPDVLNKCVSHR